MARIFILGESETGNQDQDKVVNTSFNPLPDKYTPNSELEKGEILLHGDLSGIYRVNGKKHSKGGTPALLNDGDFIFSDDKSLAITEAEKKLFELKDGGSKKKRLNTPARVVQRNVDLKHYNTLIKNLNDNKADEITKTSSSLMLGKYVDTLGKISFIQENKKNSPPPEFAMQSAPVYDTELKGAIDQNEQYMKSGGKFQRGGQRSVWDEINRRLANFDKRILNWPTGRNRWGNQAEELLPFTPPATQGPTYIAPSPLWEGQQRYPSEGNLLSGIYGPRPIDLEMPADYYRPSQPVELIMPPDSAPAPTPTMPVTETVTTPRGNRIPVPRYVPRPLKTSFSSAPREDQQRISIYDGPVKSGEYTKKTVLPYNPRLGMSPLQSLNLLYSAQQALTVPRFYPMRPQVTSPTIELERANPQSALNQVDNSAFAAYSSVKGLSPALAAVNAASIFGRSLDAKAQVAGQYENMNTQISNQQNQMNNQIQTQDALRNAQMNLDYYNNLQNLNQNYADERRAATNRALSLLNRTRSENDALAMTLASQRMYTKPVLDANGNQVYDRDGNPVYQAAPIMDVDISGWTPRIYNTGAGTIFDAPSGGDPTGALKQYIDSFVSSGMDPNKAVVSAIKLLEIQSKNQGRPVQKKGGIYRRLRK